MLALERETALRHRWRGLLDAPSLLPKVERLLDARPLDARRSSSLGHALDGVIQGPAVVEQLCDARLDGRRLGLRRVRADARQAVRLVVQHGQGPAGAVEKDARKAERLSAEPAVAVEVDAEVVACRKRLADAGVVRERRLLFAPTPTQDVPVLGRGPRAPRGLVRASRSLDADEHALPRRGPPNIPADNHRFFVRVDADALDDRFEERRDCGRDRRLRRAQIAVDFVAEIRVVVDESESQRRQRRQRGLAAASPAAARRLHELVVAPLPQGDEIFVKVVEVPGRGGDLLF
mmetsp:Transcript_31782/g.107828  ORF Transcript_31782/g.107828 Transcript_31782/m.107828 type:complete len:291 (+) Transcript_31782:766-1638(+)